MIKPVSSMSTGPLPPFTCCEVGFLIRSNAVCNTMTVNKVFRRSIVGHFHRRVACMQGKQICMQS